MNGAHNGQEIYVLRTAAADNLVQGRRRTASQILIVPQLTIDLRPDPSVNKKLKLSLCIKKREIESWPGEL